MNTEQSGADMIFAPTERLDYADLNKASLLHHQFFNDPTPEVNATINAEEKLLQY